MYLKKLKIQLHVHVYQENDFKKRLTSAFSFPFSFLIVLLSFYINV